MYYEVDGNKNMEFEEITRPLIAAIKEPCYVLLPASADGQSFCYDGSW